MKNLNIAIGTVLLAGCVFAAETVKKEDLSKLPKAQRIARRDKIVMEKNGGFVTVKGTPSGSVVVLNAQKQVTTDNFEITKSRSFSRLDGLVKIVDGEAATVATAADLKKKYKADFIVFVVDDKALPPSLVAPEARWGIVNVAGLEPGAATPEMVRIRTRNEFARVFSMTCGGYASQFQAPLMNLVKTVDDLDNCLADVPVDVSARVISYLNICGIKPEQKVTYRRACQEGWAAQPTNKFQKAVWDEVHKLPTKPLKLEK